MTVPREAHFPATHCVEKAKITETKTQLCFRYTISRIMRARAKVPVTQSL